MHASWFSWCLDPFGLLAAPHRPNGMNGLAAASIIRIG
jgi:hypothetical protein